MPIYFITTPTGNKLIEAKNEAQAIRHIVETTITAKACGVPDIVKYMGDGMKVELAGAKPAAQA